jgi:hypothetical protein
VHLIPAGQRVLEVIDVAQILARSVRPQHNGVP